MERRTFLAAIAGVSLAGCTSDSPSTGNTPAATPTATPTGTPTSTPSATPRSTPAPAPEVLSVTVHAGNGDRGTDPDERAVEVTAGAVAVVAYRYRVPVHSGTIHAFEQVEVSSSGGSVAVRRRRNQRLTAGGGTVRARHAVAFDTSEWTPGRHTAEVTVRDRVTGELSLPTATEFDVVESGGG